MAESPLSTTGTAMPRRASASWRPSQPRSWRWSRASRTRRLCPSGVEGPAPSGVVLGRDKLLGDRVYKFTEFSVFRIGHGVSPSMGHGDRSHKRARPARVRDVACNPGKDIGVNIRRLVYARPVAGEYSCSLSLTTMGDCLIAAISAYKGAPMPHYSSSAVRFSRPEHGCLIRSYAATATMTSVPQVPASCASALVRAKHRGHVACPQASLSTLTAAPPREPDGCATLPWTR